MDYRNEKITEEKKKKMMGIEDMFFKMRSSGKTVREIAKSLKKSYSTISDLNKKYFREISDIRNEKLEVLQRKMYEQKQERLDFLTEQLRIVKEAIKEKNVSLNYGDLVTLAIKISFALNKCERDMRISDLLNADFQKDESQKEDSDNNLNPSDTQEEKVDSPDDSRKPETDVSEKKPDNEIVNNEVKSKAKISGNSETKKKKSASKKREVKQKEVKDKKVKQMEDKQKEVIQKAADAPPKTRADFYRKYANMRVNKPPGG